jgi:hypothetical protein
MEKLDRNTTALNRGRQGLHSRDTRWRGHDRRAERELDAVLMNFWRRNVSVARLRLVRPAGVVP